MILSQWSLRGESDPDTTTVSDRNNLNNTVTDATSEDEDNGNTSWEKATCSEIAICDKKLTEYGKGCDGRIRGACKAVAGYTTISKARTSFSLYLLLFLLKPTPPTAKPVLALLPICRLSRHRRQQNQYQLFPLLASIST